MSEHNDAADWPGPPPPYTDTETWLRFTEKIVRTARCWIWTGAVSDGYGMFHDARNVDNGRLSPTVRVSRWIWSAYNGELPSWRNVMHECDTPLCVRFDGAEQHLTPGTQAENIQQAACRDRITNLGRLGRADLRGQHQQSLAIRAAMRAARAQGITDLDRLAEILASVISEGNPYAAQEVLF